MKHFYEICRAICAKLLLKLCQCTCSYSWCYTKVHINAFLEVLLTCCFQNSKHQDVSFAAVSYFPQSLLYVVFNHNQIC